MAIGFIIIGVGIGLFLLFLISVGSWYTIVPPSEAHLVVTPTRSMVCSPDKNISKDDGPTYYAVPEWIPFIGRQVRKLNVTIREIVVEQETIEKGQARYNVSSSLKYRIVDVQTASETFTNEKELQGMLQEVVKSAVREVTVKYDLTDARAKKNLMAKEIGESIKDDLQSWGLRLENFQLVDFADTSDSKIVSNISKRREVEIESTTRQENAERLKLARIKEAESEEKAKEREIERDQKIAERLEKQKQFVADEQKTTQEKAFEVLRIQTIKQAEIDKEKAIVEANKEKETEYIHMTKKELEGKGDRIRAEERAKGEASPIRERGLAEAEAKEKLQEALNKFGEAAIKALVAEKLVEMQKEVGVASAKALEKSEMKIFIGNNESKSGFDLGQVITSMSVSSQGTSDSVLNRLARPNDLGIGTLSVNIPKPKE